MNTVWKTFSKVPVPDLKTQLLLDIADNKNLYGRNALKFIIGGDSQYHKTYVTYTTVLVIVREGHGGLGYYRNVYDRNVHITRQQRLFKETYDAVELALWINPTLENIGFKINEIHTDLNPNKDFASSDMVQSCLGYIRGMGFEGIAKPHSWAAMEIADRFSK